MKVSNQMVKEAMEGLSAIYVSDRLLAKEMREEACDISQNTEYIELAVRSDFQRVFADSMFFPKALNNS